MLKCFSSKPEINALFLTKNIKSLLPIKPFSKSSIPGERPHPWSFPRTMCPQVSIKTGALILRQSRKAGTLVASPPPFSGDLWDSMLCSPVLKALFSLYLSKMTWKFFFPSPSPPPSHSKNNANSGKAVLNYWPLWQTTRIQGKARGKGKRKPKPRANDFPQQEFCHREAVFYLGHTSLEQVLSYVFLAPVLRLIFSSERKGRGKGKPRLKGRS